MNVRRPTGRQAAIVAVVALAAVAVASISLLSPERSGKALTPAAGGGQQSLDLALAIGGYQSSAWIEQQDDWPMPATPIVNPDPTCTWSVNDHSDWSADGYLDPGATTTRSSCIVSDFNPVTATRNGTTATWNMAPYGFAGLSLLSPSSDLTVIVCYQPQARCFAPGSVYDVAVKQWRYTFCGRANYQPDDAALVAIAGSNGGRGVITTVTITLTNPTARRVRNLFARGGFSSDVTFPTACNPVPTQTTYPFTWAST